MNILKTRGFKILNPIKEGSKGIAHIRPLGEYTWSNLWLLYRRCYTSRRLRHLGTLVKWRRRRHDARTFGASQPLRGGGYRG